MKKIIALMLLLVFAMPLHAARAMDTRGMTPAEITARALGFWKTVNKKIENAQAIVAVYEYDGRLYARIIALYNPDSGKFEDDIYQQKMRSSNIEGNPPYCGMDILFGMEHHRDARFDNGRIFNPESGRKYNASAKLLEDNTLRVTGRYLFFRRSQILTRIDESFFPENFEIPDIKTFTPVVPVRK